MKDLISAYGHCCALVLSAEEQHCKKNIYEMEWKYGFLLLSVQTLPRFSESYEMLCFISAQIMMEKKCCFLFQVFNSFCQLKKKKEMAGIC